MLIKVLIRLAYIDALNVANNFFLIASNYFIIAFQILKLLYARSKQTNYSFQFYIIKTLLAYNFQKEPLSKGDSVHFSSNKRTYEHPEYDGVRTNNLKGGEYGTDTASG